MAKKKLIIYPIILILLAIFYFSTYNLIKWHIDNQKTLNVLENINNNATVIEKEDSENTTIIDPLNELDEKDPYWQYITMNLMEVDLAKLKEENEDTKGWIKVEGTNVNYPFVQTTDNDYYLYHSFNKESNEAGWIFLDYRNNIEKLDKNTIIYGHGRLNKTMFGSLNNILEDSWLENPDNFVIKMSTEKENTLWQIFSAYHLPTTSDYLYINFASDEEFMKFTDKITARSMYDFKTEVNADDLILTLSTCYNNDEKMVIHAKLIKKEYK